MIKKDDFIDVYVKLKQRGLKFLTTKLNPRKLERTKSAFNDDQLFASHWWIVPEVRRRWNKLITGDAHIEYEDYLLTQYLNHRSDWSMVSFGSGVCSHEISLAESGVFSKVVCVDIAEKLLNKAETIAKGKGLNEMQFIAQDLYKIDFEEAEFDIVFFHASLHHFADIEALITNKILKILKPNGLVIINEYVGANRMQFPKYQLKAINEAIKLIPQEYRHRYGSNTIKTSVSGPGLIRMFLADPSECVESENILPLLRKYFKTIEEKPYGGNLLMYALKDISHHFQNANSEQMLTLNELFELEDAYLKKHRSDFVFGLYKKP